MPVIIISIRLLPGFWKEAEAQLENPIKGLFIKAIGKRVGKAWQRAQG